MKTMLLTSLAAVALSALLASGAAAGARPDDRPGPRGPAAASAGPIELDPALAAVVAQAHSRPALDTGLANALASARNAAAREQLLDPAIRNALAGSRGREPGPRIAVPASATPHAASDGFHWRDAVAGAGFALALVALAFVAVRLARRSRPRIAV
jgi:hypothetical protein